MPSLSHRTLRDDNLTRIHNLADRLELFGPLAVRHNTWGLFGDRARIELDDDTTLRLRLFWKRSHPLAALTSIWWKETVGWVVVARTTAGDQLWSYAWYMTITPPRDG